MCSKFFKVILRIHTFNRFFELYLLKIPHFSGSKKRHKLCWYKLLKNYIIKLSILVNQIPTYMPSIFLLFCVSILPMVHRNSIYIICVEAELRQNTRRSGGLNLNRILYVVCVTVLNFQCQLLYTKIQNRRQNFVWALFCQNYIAIQPLNKQQPLTLKS